MEPPNHTQVQQEAISKLEAEAQERIDHIRQSVDFHLAALRAQGNMEINKMLLSVRQMTMEEYCHVYGANPQLILEAQTRKRKRTDLGLLKRAVQSKKTTDTMEVDKEEHSNMSKPSGRVATLEQNTTSAAAQVRAPLLETLADNQRVSKADIPGTIGKKQEEEKKEEEEEEEEENDFGPLFVHLVRDKHPRVTFRLDAQKDTSQLGRFELSAPDEILDELNSHQRRRVQDQLDDILGQLEHLKQRLQ